ncbi:MAG: hypothetical protein HQL94_05015 [Magnetococcales bacterium]|nr:hypothetical protein [Magnetococcales bacterium]MBF0438748.1 hypothetical protein [Magnetococcales bacterium]
MTYWFIRCSLIHPSRVSHLGWEFLARHNLIEADLQTLKEWSKKILSADQVEQIFQ